jgi:hypothetical protein
LKEFPTSRESVRNFIADLGQFALLRFSSLDDDGKRAVEKYIGPMFILAIDGIAAISAEGGGGNEAAEHKLLNVLPRELMAISPPKFKEVILQQTERLRRGRRQRLCADLERAFKDFKEAAPDDSSLAAALEKQLDTVSFTDGWEALRHRFPKLRQFCGSITTVFPGTSTVESDFSILNWEYDEFRSSLTEFSLEGIMPCKQFKRLQDLKHFSSLLV